ncbi:MAG: hypothetical protein K2P84_00040 [Undibacterium sp.]|nr:hypothetical protein [Undibacterium sp.]
MSQIDLRFNEQLHLSHPIDLIFDGDIGQVQDNVLSLDASIGAPSFNARVISQRSLIVDAQIAGPTLTVKLQVSQQLTLRASINAPTCEVMLSYDAAVYRGMNNHMQSRWQVADGIKSDTQDRTQTPIKQRVFTQDRLQAASVINAQVSIAVTSGMSLNMVQSAIWHDGITLDMSASDGFKCLQKVPLSCDLVWQLGDVVQSNSVSLFRDRLRLPRPSTIARWASGELMQVSRQSYAGIATPRLMSRATIWQVTTRPTHGKYVKPIDPPKPDTDYKPLTRLLFKDLLIFSTHLIFGDAQTVPNATKIIPVRRSYIVINNVQLRRVDGNHVLPDVSLSMSINMDAWTWAFSASMPAYCLALIEPSSQGEPVLLEANINGAGYLLLAENIQRDRSFGKSSITVSGRGQSAMLADPYSPLLSFRNTMERSAQQLMQDVLQINGVSLGWNVDWHIEDWLVPVGAWSHQGSYMSACTTIASAAGAFIQPDALTKTLRVRHRVPVKPWEMNGTLPDLELPSSVVVKESVAWYDKPAYNAIYLSGSTSGGVLGQVKRSGSAGDVVAPMIVDALMTSEIVVRQRGIAELAKAGRGAVLSLSLPVLADVGIIEPGTLVRYVASSDASSELMGTVTAVSVNAQNATVRQTIEMQTYG